MSQFAPTCLSQRQTASLRWKLHFAIFMLCFGIFFISPNKEVEADPKYSMLVSESILKHGTPALNEIAIPELERSRLPAHLGSAIKRPFYQLVKADGKIQYSYPHGSSLLALPFVAALNVAGISAVDTRGRYNYSGEIWIQKIISSLIMAVTVCLFFESASCLLPCSWSLAIAFGAAFGTQIWSTATRALWSLTWEVFLGACLVLLLLKREEGSSCVSTPLLATLVAWMYFVRPDGVITVVALSILFFFRYRNDFFTYAATGLLWLIFFLIYSSMIFGQLLPDYYRQSSALHINNWLEAFAGCLISPSRGLLIFVPPCSLVLCMAARHWNSLRAKPLALVACAVILSKLTLVAAWPIWWGGFSYGPRLLTDLVPWFVLLAILGFQAHLDYNERFENRASGSARSLTVTAMATLLTLFSVGINGYGAWSAQAQLWNWRVAVDQHPERIWDWRTPQFLAGLAHRNR